MLFGGGRRKNGGVGIYGELGRGGMGVELLSSAVLLCRCGGFENLLLVVLWLLVLLLRIDSECMSIMDWMFVILLFLIYVGLLCAVMKSSAFVEA